mgnify:CR=1 FL=1
MEKKQKVRKTVNVSLQKRHIDSLNAILNSWEEDGCNISHEICEAILFKNKSDINPHICTILSTLSLIESSLKSQKTSRDMTPEQIDSKALEIFNDVITIDIDGNKLTNLLKGVNMKASNQKLEQNTQAEDIKIESKSNDLKADLTNNEPVIESNIPKDEEIALTKNDKCILENTTKIFEEEEYEIENEVALDGVVPSKSSGENLDINPKEYLKEVCDKEISKKSEPIVWKNFPDEKVGSPTPKVNNNISDTIFGNFAIASDFTV